MLGGLAEVDIPIDSLLPMQSGVSRIGTLRYLASADLDELPPIKTVLFNDDSEHPLHLIVEGHHRTYNAYRRGRDVIRGLIAREDEHLALLGASAVTGCDSIEALRQRYEREWQPSIISTGVTSVALMIPVIELWQPEQQ